jgi:NADH dehydrogenase
LHRVAVIGAGFGGLAAARALSGKQLQVTLVDQRNFHTFLPLLYEVATAGLDPGDVAYPVRAVIGRTPNIRFRLGTVTGIVLQERMVCFNSKEGGHNASNPGCEDDVPYDSLILASGAIANFFGIPGAAECALPLYTLEDARHLRDHLLLCLEEADGELAHASDGTLTFVVVGGGPTGVEVSGAIAELLDMSMERDGFHFDRSMARVVLVDGFDHLLGPFKLSAQRYAEETLRGRSVELALGKMVARITAAEVELNDGTVIATRTVIWAGGVTVNGTAVTALGTPTSPNGRLVVDSTLMVSGYPDVYAIGDCAAIPVSPGSELTCPQLAQVAIQSGQYAAAQIVAGLAGRPLPPFSYRDKGIMATIGRRAAIAQLRNGLVLRGTLGWIAWFGLHLVYLVGFRNKTTVFVNWWWRYLNWTSGPRVIFSSGSGAQEESRSATST